MIRVKNYIIDFIFNGLFLTCLFFLVKFTFLYFSPTSLFFEYSSVEPVTVPVNIGQDYIEMQSELINRQIGNMEWNDVLRCRNHEGTFSYIGQWDTNAETVIVSDDFYYSTWTYRGEMPTNSGICRIDSTITRNLSFGIQKTQFIQSALFRIE